MALLQEFMALRKSRRLGEKMSMPSFSSLQFTCFYQQQHLVQLYRECNNNTLNSVVV